MTAIDSNNAHPSTIVDSNEKNYVKAIPDLQITKIPLGSTKEFLRIEQTVSTSKTSGIVKLRLAPREMPDRMQNKKNR